MLGDEGSGYAIGMTGLKHVAASFDGRATGILPAMVKQHLGIDTGADLTRKVYQEKWPAQEVAPLVVRRQNRATARLTRSLTRRLVCW